MQAIQGVSEIVGDELHTCYLDLKEETSYKRVSYGALFSRYDHFTQISELEKGGVLPSSKRRTLLISVVKSLHVHCMDLEMVMYNIGCIGSCCGNRREGHHWGDLGVDGWIILG